VATGAGWLFYDVSALNDSKVADAFIGLAKLFRAHYQLPGSFPKSLDSDSDSSEFVMPPPRQFRGGRKD